MMRPLCLLGAGLVLALGAGRAPAQSTPKFLHHTAAEWATQLRSGDAAARRNAAFALGKMGSFAAQALPEVKRSLRQEKDPRVREALVTAAGEIAAGTFGGDPELEAMLIEGLRDPDKLLRRSAACALGQIAGKDDAVRGALAQALRDPEQIVRQNAAWALGQLDEEFRAAVVLKDIEDMDYAAIAEVLDVPVGTVKSRIHRGRLMLRDLLRSERVDVAGR